MESTPTKVDAAALPSTPTQPNTPSTTAMPPTPAQHGAAGLSDPAATRTAAEEAAQLLFAQVSAMVSAEMKAGSDDYAMLERMNAMAGAKYKEMSTYTAGLVAVMDRLGQQRAELIPQLEGLDKVLEGIDDLERAAQYLDAYTAKLEAAAKNL